MLKKEESGTEISILQAARGTIDFCIVGTSPYICNRMAQKVWFELLAPRGKKTTVEKASTMKHDPIKEFRNSPYILTDPDSPTLLAMLPTAFKAAMGTAALETPGAKKAQIGRLVSVEWNMQPIFGIPRVGMDIVRSADMNKTPDVRTRAYLEEWACYLSVTFMKPMLREQAIINLLASAGLISGVGDWRQQKGSGSFGCFRLASRDDPDFVRIVKTQGRAAQQEAMDNPVCRNADTEELLAWFYNEVSNRGFALQNGQIAGPKTTNEIPAPVVEKAARKSRNNGGARV